MPKCLFRTQREVWRIENHWFTLTLARDLSGAQSW